MKLRVQAQHLQVGDIVVGTKEEVVAVTLNGISWPTKQCKVVLFKHHGRVAMWNKSTMINIERASNE